MKAYLDNAATTMVAKEVVAAMLPYMNETYGNASSLHSFGVEAKKALEEARGKIAEKIGAENSQIIFTSGGTESDNLAIRGACLANPGKKHIITSKIEHPAVLNTCQDLEKAGYKVTYLNVDGEGFVSLDALEKAIIKDTLLVSIMHANNEIGTVQDIEAIGKVCRKHGVLFHSDAVQSFCKEDIDVAKMNIDMLSISSHKIHGPKGVGALFVREKQMIKPIMSGGAHESGKRPGTENVAGAVGFAAAAGLAKNADIEYMRGLRDWLIGEMEKIPHTKVNGSKVKKLCNNVNVTFQGIEGESLLLHLDRKGVAVSTGSACSSHSLKPSHVLMALGIKQEESHGSIRVTISRYTTKEEIEYAAGCIKEVVEKLRKLSPTYVGD